MWRSLLQQGLDAANEYAAARVVRTVADDNESDESGTVQSRRTANNAGTAAAAPHWELLRNNLQAVAWREWLLHTANRGEGLDPAGQALLSGVVCSLPWSLKLLAAIGRRFDRRETAEYRRCDCRDHHVFRSPVAVDSIANILHALVDASTFFGLRR